MTAVSYEVFLPEVMPYVHDVPEIVAVQAIRNACIEFCEETQYLNPWDWTHGEREFQFED